MYEAKQRLGDNDFDPQTLAELKYLHSTLKGKLSSTENHSFLTIGHPSKSDHGVSCLIMTFSNSHNSPRRLLPIRMTQLINSRKFKFTEILRKYPAMGWLDRLTGRDYRIDDKLVIPAGMPVYINSAAIQYNPKYYPNPQTFDPDRFMPGNEGNLKPFTFLPFGEGPRNCIGMI